MGEGGEFMDRARRFTEFKRNDFAALPEIFQEHIQTNNNLDVKYCKISISLYPNNYSPKSPTDASSFVFNAAAI